MNQFSDVNLYMLAVNASLIAHSIEKVEIIHSERKFSIHTWLVPVMVCNVKTERVLNLFLSRPWEYFLLFSFPPVV